MKYAACDALVLLRLYDAMSFEVEDLYSKPVDIETLKVDVELPIFVHIPADKRQEDRHEIVRARTVGLLPAGTISGEGKSKKFPDKNNDDMSKDMLGSECTTSEEFDMNIKRGNSGDYNGIIVNGKRERSVSIGEFRRGLTTATTTPFNTQRKTIWIPHHRKITKI